jgi:aspartate ammonia-lyase
VGGSIPATQFVGAETLRALFSSGMFSIATKKMLNSTVHLRSQNQVKRVAIRLHSSVTHHLDKVILLRLDLP